MTFPTLRTTAEQWAQPSLRSDLATLRAHWETLEARRARDPADWLLSNRYAHPALDPDYEPELPVRYY